ncbi:MAG: hypothetical protein A3C55_00850 [Gammaproteobacteria bacterium RIFCSPHIGHO2_02_FULL_42_13]|nr:MAG: hypothetical protein A3C55_00850 [Gammaproteobacteria bacterium RIFCSPHIGHO2_02_FULL_42_13]OGT70362.1 MAG: hypothetical protein A3H43_02715 [Gammaproteobacteria bacterium RIFCSPLOWO2_02_FULL_42_9]
MRKIKTISICAIAIFVLQTGYAASRAQYAITGAVVGAAIGTGAGAIVASNAMIPGAVIGGGVGAIAGSGIYGSELEHAQISVVDLPGKTIIVIPSDNLFEINTANFLPNATDILADVQNMLPADKDIYISANTDPIGASISFQGSPLSEQQAAKVAGYFWANGLKINDANQNIHYHGNDDDYPIASNDRLEGMTINRRIQITLVPHEADITPTLAQNQTLIPTQHKLIIPRKYSK